ncbi:11868_t:CDS:2 [Ambispora gerdemannii]|uniref:11868_t:CDS:1 n=1 Tax=Ambispora gerdemannii TaxID=144530 RepID=A0A9N8VUI6_9GLOM|nr:11868_t:CDS:2 [Ambispora gerdemannii]
MQVEIVKSSHGKKKFRRPERSIPEEIKSSLLEQTTPRKLWTPQDGIQAKMTKLNDTDEFQRNAPPPTRPLFDHRRDPIILVPKASIGHESQKPTLNNASYKNETVNYTHTRRASTHFGSVTNGKKLYNPYSDEESDSKKQAQRDIAKPSRTHARTKSAHDAVSVALKNNEIGKGAINKEERDAKVLKNLAKEIALMEKQLFDLSSQINSNNAIDDVPKIASRQYLVSEEYWEERMSFHLRLAQKYIEFTQIDKNVAMKQDFESKCWKYAFYTLIEEFRNALSIERASTGHRSYTNSIVLKQFGKFLNESETFYIELLKNSIQKTKSNEIPPENSQLPKWFRCISCLGDLARYRWTYSLNDHEDKKHEWAMNASNWYKLGITLNPSNGKFYHHLAILASNDEMQKLYYFCRSLLVKTPFIIARESAIPFFEANRQLFIPNVNDTKQKTRRGYLHKRESNSTCSTSKATKLISNQDIQSLFVRLHGMLFTKIGLENFNETLRIFVHKTSNINYLQKIDKVENQYFLELCLQLAVINLSSIYCYGNNEGSSLIKAIEASINDREDNVKILDSDIAFTNGVNITFELMRQFMGNYLSDEVNSEGHDITEGWLLYCEVVLMWMVASCAFDNFAAEFQSSIWEKLSGKAICPRFWETIANFLTKITRQVSAFTKEEIISSNGSIFPPPLAEDWELRGICWLRQIHPNNYFKEEIDLLTSNFNAEKLNDYIAPTYSLKLDPDAKVRRRARIFELGILLAKKINGLEFDEKLDSFSSLPELDEDVKDTKIKSELLFENELSQSKSDWAEEVENVIQKELSDQEEDENIKELKARRANLEMKTAALIDSRVTPKKSHVNEKKTELIPIKKSPKSASKILPGYTTFIVDTNCLVGDLYSVKKIIKSEKWNVLAGLTLNPPPLGNSATEALNYLKQAMSSGTREIKLKVQTSKGNYISDISFNEEFDFGYGEDKKKNLDDIILGICLWHAKNHPDTGNQNNGNQNERVVLLTNDRNLRVKARARDVNVVNVQDFKNLIG